VTRSAVRRHGWSPFSIRGKIRGLTSPATKSAGTPSFRASSQVKGSGGNVSDVLRVCTLSIRDAWRASQVRSYAPGPKAASRKVRRAPSRFPASSCATLSLIDPPNVLRRGWASALSFSPVIKPPEPARLFQHETPYESRMIAGHEERHETAVRMADEVNRPQSERSD
jgi:hypothetical protein